MPKPGESESTKITINNITTSIPFVYHLDAKGINQKYITFGFESSCNLDRDNVFTFNHQLIKLTDEMKTNFTRENEILLVAECSDTPKLAIFVAYKENNKEFKYVKIYVGGRMLLIQASDDSDPKIEFEGNQIDIKNSPFTYPEDEPLYFDFR